MDNIIEIKKEFRKKQSILRDNLKNKNIKSFNLDLFEKLFKIINFDRKKIVSSFISINSEIDTTELNNYILKKNLILCLPTIVNKNEALVFKEFKKNDNFIKGYMKINEPPTSNEVLIPKILFVPCLAFDNLGYRLGYGGGYYDKTFNHLKVNNYNFTSIGYAFDDQEVSNVPRDNLDIKLDYVITEKNIYNYK